MIVEDRLTWSKRIAAFAALQLILATAACTGSQATSIPPASIRPGTMSTTGVIAPSQSASPEPAQQSDLADLEVLWNRLWDATGLVPAERGSAIAELGHALRPMAAESVQTILIDATERRVSTFPVFDERSDGVVGIRDCIIYEPTFLESATHVQSGTAIPDGDGGWIIDSVTRETAGCIPAELQEEVLEDYAEFWAALAGASDPANPDDPRLEQNTAGAYRDVIRDRLVDAQVKGRYAQFDILGLHPEITNVGSATTVEVLDCIEVGPGEGLYEANGDRVGGEAANPDGKRDLYTISLTRERGRWKVGDTAVKISEACEFAPTSAGLQLIGP